LEEQLKDAVRASGRSLRQLGEAAGIADGALSRFMRGERSLTLPAADRLCQALGLRLVGAPAPPPKRRGNK
jgi:transcriptional regulator with XRE-family HTH domain